MDGKQQEKRKDVWVVVSFLVCCLRFFCAVFFFLSFWVSTLLLVVFVTLEPVSHPEVRVWGCLPLHRRVVVNISPGLHERRCRRVGHDFTHCLSSRSRCDGFADGGWANVFALFCGALCVLCQVVGRGLQPEKERRSGSPFCPTSFKSDNWSKCPSTPPTVQLNLCCSLSQCALLVACALCVRVWAAFFPFPAFALLVGHSSKPRGSQFKQASQSKSKSQST